ncbi:MAG: hypothetical protein RIA65_01460, partial [Woeseia sp.]
MSKSNASSAAKELQTFLKRQPKSTSIELLITDINGVPRSKRIKPKEFSKTFADGFCMPGGTVLLDTLGNTIPGIHYSADDGDPDVAAEIVAGSLAPLPWSRKPSGQALFRFRLADGTPFFADPRSVLERALQPLQRMKLKVVMATELEFYLLEAKADGPTASVSR